jgi:hypothetical protein
MGKVKKPAARTHAFDPPAEADWHRKISEAAYYRSQKPEFFSESALDHWLAAESEVKALLSAEAKAPRRRTRSTRNR